MLRQHQWIDWLTTIKLMQRLDIAHALDDVQRQHCMHWLGHIPGMENTYLLVQLLFGQATAIWPRHGPKRRWPGLTVSDLQELGILE